MPERNDGGPAFPDADQSDGTGGMSLRDYFAAHYEPPWESVLNVAQSKHLVAEPNTGQILDATAELKLRYADEMLKARKVNDA